MSGVPSGGRLRSSGRNRGPLTDPSHRSFVVGQSAICAALYGGTSEIMKTIIAREVTGLRT